MPDIKGTTRAQTIFLRGFRKSRIGPPLEDWPTPAVFRRWLRRPAFRRALDSLRDSLRYQADFQLAMSAAHGSINLSEMFLNNQAEHLIPQIFHVLDLSHRRQRFTQPKPEPESDDDWTPKRFIDPEGFARLRALREETRRAKNTTHPPEPDAPPHVT